MISKQVYFMEDCIEGCKERITHSSVDLVFADPPFNIQFGGKQSRSYSYDVSSDKSIYYHDDMTKDDYIQWCSKWMQAAWNILKENGIFVLMSSWNHVSAIEIEANRIGFVTLNHLIWRYEFGVFTRSKLTTSHYTFLILLKGDDKSKSWTFNSGKKGYQEDVERRIRLFLLEIDKEERDKNVIKLARLLENMMYENFDHVSEKDFFDDIRRLSKMYVGIKHPCKLNENVLIKIFSIFSNIDDFVVDLFMGSGTSFVAATVLDRNYIGFEIDNRYKSEIDQLISSRLEKRASNKKLF